MNSHIKLILTTLIVRSRQMRHLCLTAIIHGTIAGLRTAKKQKQKNVQQRRARLNRFNIYTEHH